MPEQGWTPRDGVVFNRAANAYVRACTRYIEEDLTLHPRTVHMVLSCEVRLSSMPFTHVQDQGVKAARWLQDLAKIAGESYVCPRRVIFFQNQERPARIMLRNQQDPQCQWYEVGFDTARNVHRNDNEDPSTKAILHLQD